MKKIFLTICGIISLGLTSCDLGGDENTSNTTYGTINLVTENATGKSLMSTSLYSFNMNLNQATATVGTTNLLYPSNGSTSAKFNFTTQPTSYYQGIFPNGTFLMVVKTATGNVDNDPSLPLQGFQARVTNNVYTTNSEQSYINYMVGLSDSSVGQPVMISEYSIGSDYNVRTLPIVSFYKGTTTTIVEGGSFPPYSTGDMLYGVFFHKDLDKADVVIYQAKFAEAAPSLTAVVLKDLTVSCSNRTYTITGKDVIPQVVEGSGLTPNERFPFKEFKFEAGGSWLHSATITYKVGDNYNGRFYGTYISEEVITQN